MVYVDPGQWGFKSIDWFGRVRSCQWKKNCLTTKLEESQGKVCSAISASFMVRWRQRKHASLKHTGPQLVLTMLKKPFHVGFKSVSVLGDRNAWCRVSVTQFEVGCFKANQHNSTQLSFPQEEYHCWCFFYRLCIYWSQEIGLIGLRPWQLEFPGDVPEQSPRNARNFRGYHAWTNKHDLSKRCCEELVRSVPG